MDPRYNARMTTLLAAALLGTQQRPVGLFMAGENWFYFTSKGAAQALRDNKLVVIGGARENPAGGFFGTWTGHVDLRKSPKGVWPYPHDPKHRLAASGPMASGDYTATEDGGTWTYFLKGSTGSDRFGGRLVPVGSGTPDFFTGTWKGGKLELRLVQDEKSVRGSASFAGTEYAVKGERHGAAVDAALFTMDKGQRAFVFGLVYDPTNRAVQQMKFDGKFQSDRLLCVGYDRDRVEFTEMKRGD